MERFVELISGYAAAHRATTGGHWARKHDFDEV